MTKLLVNLLIFSFGFIIVAARCHEKITFRLSGRIALIGLFFFCLVAIFGMVVEHQTFEKTFLVLDSKNDMQMGVIYGVASIYISFLCLLWCISRYLQMRYERK